MLNPTRQRSRRRHDVLGVGKFKPHPECATRCVEHLVDDLDHGLALAANRVVGPDGCRVTQLDLPIITYRKEGLDVERVDPREVMI